MRKYYITRKSAVTTCSVKAVNTTTFEVVDIDNYRIDQVLVTQAGAASGARR